MAVPDQNRKNQIIWFAFVQCLVLYGAMIFFLKGEDQSLPIPAIDFLCVGALFAFLPHIFKYFERLSGLPLVVKLVIAEVPGILGLVVNFVSGDRGTALKLAGLSLLSLLFLFPFYALKRNESEGGGDGIPPPIG